jgi:hypothetical protein
MLAEMSEATFRDWQQYYAEEPFGPGVLNLMLARVAGAAAGEPEGNFIPTVGEE